MLVSTCWGHGQGMEEGAIVDGAAGPMGVTGNACDIQIYRTIQNVESQHLEAPTFAPSHPTYTPSSPEIQEPEESHDMMSQLEARLIHTEVATASYQAGNRLFVLEKYVKHHRCWLGDSKSKSLSILCWRFWGTQTKITNVNVSEHRKAQFQTELLLDLGFKE